MTMQSSDQITHEIRLSQERWRLERRYLDQHRHELSHIAATQLHADHLQVEESGLLTSPEWLPPAPIPLADIRLSWWTDIPTPFVNGTEAESAGVRPLDDDGNRFSTYAAALGALAPPRLFEDRPCYRLVDVTVHARRVNLSFGTGTYFDVMNVCEAAAHELAAAFAGEGRTHALEDLPLRALVGDPCDLRHRPVIPAISALTIRRTSTGASFMLHRRDAAKVAHGGGLYQVMPVGVFQPSSAGEWNRLNDFNLWRSMAREYSEEFLGAPEMHGSTAPIDYDDWAFYQALTEAVATGRVTAHWLGLGVDPLSLVCDMLVAVVIDDQWFDSVFDQIVSVNAEGEILASEPAEPGIVGVPFTAERITQLAHEAPMQPAGAALLMRAWEHRGVLLP
jgi:hypothetical protein